MAAHARRVAPDKFAGTLTAVEAAAAMAAGWARRSPGDELVQVPMSDGGPGFVDVLHAALGGDLHAVTVSGPVRRPDARRRAACRGDGVRRVRPGGRAAPHPARGPPTGARDDRGVGEVLPHALDADVSRIVVGLGGSATNDAGAGLLAALGATSDGGELDAGPAALDGAHGGRLGRRPRARSKASSWCWRSDVDNPLLGINGATKIYGPQKGLPEERLVTVDGWLQHFAELTDRKLAAAEGRRRRRRARASR